MNALTTVTHNPSSNILAMIDRNSKLQPSTKAQYKKAISKYLETGNSLGNPEALSLYASTLPKSSQSFLKAAVKLWADKISLEAKASATPDNIGAVLASVFRSEAISKAIQPAQSKGQKAHTWLTQSEVKKLLDTANRRDKLILGLLVGAGLRREELTNLTFEDVIIQPTANKTRTVLNIHGKGAKDRIVPINDKLAEAINEWGKQLNHKGLIIRAIAKGGKIGNSISSIGIFQIVRQAGNRINKPELAPHDLRRTYAQLGYEAGITITQISKLLGHSNVATTQRYLNLDLDLETTISDFIPFS